MPTILTPVSLWKNFDCSLPLNHVTNDLRERDGITYEKVRFSGREAGDGRVSVYGVFAYSSHAMSRDGVLIIPDSRETVDESLIELFVANGYSALMVDIRGEWRDTKDYTVYPESIGYANYARAGRFIDYVDESADKTSWYEWVAVGLYARKYLADRLDSRQIGVVGLRDGGEVAWKLAYAGEFSCAVPVCAGGWRAYIGFNKFGDSEPVFDEERHRFIAAVDSQSYAPYVMCPVLMLCSTNDPLFDYDRAYDTFSRINPECASDSVISYSISCNAAVDPEGVKDMFMFLDKHVKCRQVFIPKPAELAVYADEESNLAARVINDNAGEVESVKVFMAEDCKNSLTRDWMAARPREASDVDCREYFLDIHEGASILFAICGVTYTNGFTVWSKITVKKLSGAFRNSRPAGKVMYSSRSGADCFCVADVKECALAGMFFIDYGCFPAVIDCGSGLKGLYSPCGLATYRLTNPAFAPSEDSVLGMDVFAEETGVFQIEIRDGVDGELYAAHVNVVGGAWQNVVAESKLFKNAAGKSFSGFKQGLMLAVKFNAKFAVNNVMWL